MYIPKYFEVTDRQQIFAFIAANAFGQLISNVGGRPYASHLPFLVADDGSRLYAHLAKQNPQIQELHEQEVLVTFQGAHDYISPSWYSKPGVPTWNYQAVHVYGVCKVIDDSARLKEVIEALTDKYESARAGSWQAEYNPAQLDAIAGIEISIAEVQGKFKLSQNRSDSEREQIIRKLQEVGSGGLAEAMRRSAP